MKIADFSLMVTHWGEHPCTPQELIEIAMHAEQLGFHSIGLPHVPSPEVEPYGVSYYDAFVLLPMLIQPTRRIKIGFNIAVTPLLHPYQWAKYLASLDAASDGRVIAGFGLGHRPPNARSKVIGNLGLDASKRGEISNAALELIIRLWTAEAPVSFAGAHFIGTDLVVEPKPIQKPYPEVWWAGNAPASVTRAAKFAAYLELGKPSLELARQRASQLRAATHQQGTTCRLLVVLHANVLRGQHSNEVIANQYFAAGRPEHAAQALAVGSPDRCARVIRAFNQAGATHFSLDMTRHGRDPVRTHHDQMDLFAREVIPLLS